MNIFALGPSGSNNYLILNPQLPYNFLALNPDAPQIGSVYTQFQNATNLNNLLNGLVPYLTIPPDLFYVNFMNIDTCNFQGLTNWGYILDVTNTVNIPDYRNVFGFYDGEPLADNQYPCNFGMGNFYDGQVIPNTLTNDQFRALLRLRYAYITTNCSPIAMNESLNIYVQAINPSNKAFVYRSNPNEITFAFNFIFTDLERSIINQENILPIPAGFAYLILEGVSL